MKILYKIGAILAYVVAYLVFSNGQIGLVFWFTLLVVIFSVTGLGKVRIGEGKKAKVPQEQDTA